jgi:ribonuclease Z
MYFTLANEKGRGIQLGVKVQFLGSNDALPDVNNDTASFVINSHILVDTGWCAVHNLKKNGIDPLDIDHVLFTHFHQDHYLSLPSLLFYWAMNKKNLQQLRILGPAEEVRQVVDLSLAFVQLERFFPEISQPVVVPIHAGDVYDGEDFKLSTCSSKHTIPALCYKYSHNRTAKNISFTGDTTWHPPILEHVKGSSLLIHEASFGAQEVEPDNPHAHSSAMDAARVAETAGVDKLCLVHGRTAYIEESLVQARQIFSKEVIWPHAGQVIEI